ncbi:carboxylesterase/lipase family protein [Microbacterium xanthum]|uniref:carboxylesterase/lipase family protein n=1 Tax=Microbacterium xanthum TaxID=3079794 RepID=UPI002AD49961|nr:carboxylesterase family protein [Microbacterium sp. KSW-48]MDZ8170520.1 carboxylesterase family protein [Microbacterium sp. KSW-48]
MTAGPVATIRTGRLRGLWREVDGVRSAAFLGIPYAEPPVGALRFAAPAPRAPWDGERDATAYGATPQRVDGGETLIPEPAIGGDDTLSVNVFTPAADDAGRPVVVYIHGGGYVSGSPASSWYDGAAFARDGIVTVTLSYRLGFDGFGHVPGAPANRGVRDWIAALEWVRENIAAFGGDPDDVTVAGQSAGGGAVLTLLTAPAAQGLFHRAWAMSPALADVEAETARTLSAKIAHLAGVPATVDGFGRIPREDLPDLERRAALPDTSSKLEIVRALIHDALSWGPTVDGDLVVRPAVEAIGDGVGADIPLVIGSMDDEMTFLTDDARRALRVVPPGLALRLLGVDRDTRRGYLAANRDQRRHGTAAVLGRYLGDVVFRSLVARVAAAREQSPTPTWVYRFAWASPTKGWALHCLDVPFWFDTVGAERVEAIAGTTPPRSLAAAVHGSAAAFARTGDPGWRAWTEAPGATRVFGGPASAPEVIADGYRSVAALV